LSKQPKSSYEIYNKDQRERTKINTLDDLYPSLPDQKYSIIYADPPWDYGGKMQFDKSGLKKENEDWQKKIFTSSASFKYPTLKLAELKNLDLQSISDDNCLLFMWTSNPHLAQAIELGESWGFKYRTIAFVWDKMVHNPGQYTMSYCEICLLFKRGKIPSPRGIRNAKQILHEKRGAHSAKPDEIRNRIHSMFPEQKKIEMFARNSHDNWDNWGYDEH
jgi:N6-adenosine-specific RNA methylase IME4